LNIYFSNEKNNLLPPKVAKASMSQFLQLLRVYSQQLLCIFYSFINYAEASFIAAVKNPIAAHNFAHLRVALGCRLVMVFETKTPPSPCVKKT